MVCLLKGGVAVAAFLGILSVGPAPAGEIVTIDFPGAVLTSVFGVTAEGDMVGRYQDTAGRFHGFVVKNGVFETIDVPGSVLTQVLGINSRGDMVGRYDSPDGKTHGFLRSGGTSTSIDCRQLVAVHDPVSEVVVSNDVAVRIDCDGIVANGPRDVHPVPAARVRSKPRLPAAGPGVLRVVRARGRQVRRCLCGIADAGGQRLFGV